MGPIGQDVETLNLGLRFCRRPAICRMLTGMKHRLAIIGMGCTPFGHLEDKSWSELLAESFLEALTDAGIEKNEIEVCWLDTLSKHAAAIGNEDLLKMPTRFQRTPALQEGGYSQSHATAFYSACHAVASGICGVALAVGAEKRNLYEVEGTEAPPGLQQNREDILSLTPHSINQFALKAKAYFSINGLSKEEGKKALARIAYKNHQNGGLGDKAYQKYEVSIKGILNAPVVSWPQGLLGCSQISGGAAAAIICSAGKAKRYRTDRVYIQDDI